MAANPIASRDWGWLRFAPKPTTNRMTSMTNEELTARLARPRFPRSSKYDGRWILDNMMGPHVLWLAECLSEVIELKPGMRVLDLGCGKAISSIFLAKEFGVQVVAADLWKSRR